MNSTIKSRVSRLQAILEQKQIGVGIISMTESGAWEAYKGAAEPQTFQTERAACDYLAGCKTIVIIDV